MYRLGLLACDFVPDELQDCFEDYPAMFGAALASTGIDVDWSVYRVYDGQFPASATECDGYITTGSRSSAFDEDAWISSLEQFIRSLVGSGRPLVGICFGHQVIANALGGRTERSERGWGIGFQRYETADHPAWMEPRLRQFTVPVCHQDQVTALPAGASVLAASAHCENFIIQFNETMLGIQGHPEFKKEYIEVLLDLREEIITGDVRDDAVNSLTRSHDNVDIMHWIANFLRLK